MSARRIKSYFAIASGLLAAFMLSASPSPGRPKPDDLPVRPSAITDFPQLYAENCAGCHGADGKNGAAIAMNNPTYLALAVDDASMRRVIANGVSGTPMPPFVKSAGGD